MSGMYAGLRAMTEEDWRVLARARAAAPPIPVEDEHPMPYKQCNCYCEAGMTREEFDALWLGGGDLKDLDISLVRVMLWPPEGLAVMKATRTTFSGVCSHCGTHYELEGMLSPKPKPVPMTSIPKEMVRLGLAFDEQEAVDLIRSHRVYHHGMLLIALEIATSHAKNLGLEVRI